MEALCRPLPHSGADSTVAREPEAAGVVLPARGFQAVARGLGLIVGIGVWTGLSVRRCTARTRCRSAPLGYAVFEPDTDFL